MKKIMMSATIGQQFLPGRQFHHCKGLFWAFCWFVLPDSVSINSSADIGFPDAPGPCSHVYVTDWLLCHFHQMPSDAGMLRSVLSF